MTMTEQNPLLNQQHLLDFEHLTTEHVTPALDVLLKDAEAAVTRAIDDKTPATWEAVIDPLESSL